MKVRVLHNPPPLDPLDNWDVPFATVPTSGRAGRSAEKPLTAEKRAKKLEERTRPWGADEYIYLNGVPHTYRPHKDHGTLVHLRGGGLMLLRDAYVRNMTISGPVRYRLDDLWVEVAKVKGIKWRTG